MVKVTTDDGRVNGKRIDIGPQNSERTSRGKVALWTFCLLFCIAGWAAVGIGVFMMVR